MWRAPAQMRPRRGAQVAPCMRARHAHLHAHVHICHGAHARAGKTKLIPTAPARESPQSTMRCIAMASGETHGHFNCWQHNDAMVAILIYNTNTIACVCMDFATNTTAVRASLHTPLQSLHPATMHSHNAIHSRSFHSTCARSVHMHSHSFVLVYTAFIPFHLCTQRSHTFTFIHAPVYAASVHSIHVSTCVCSVHMHSRSFHSCSFHSI